MAIPALPRRRSVLFPFLHFFYATHSARGTSFDVGHVHPGPRPKPRERELGRSRKAISSSPRQARRAASTNAHFTWMAHDGIRERTAPTARTSCAALACWWSASQAPRSPSFHPTQRSPGRALALTTAIPRRSSPWPSSGARCIDGAPWPLRLAGESTATSADCPSACTRGWTGRRYACRGTRTSFGRVLTSQPGAPPAAPRHRPPRRRRHGLTPAADQGTLLNPGSYPGLPPGCCASSSALPNLADRHQAAGPRRLPVLPSRCPAPSSPSPMPGSCTTLARLLYGAFHILRSVQLELIVGPV